jgi:hypothetical protein
MKVKGFKIGDTVKFGAPGGSIGKVHSFRTDGPFKKNPAMHVQWSYGLDKFGEPMTAMSFYVNPDMLMRITKKEWSKVHNNPSNW